MNDLYAQDGVNVDAGDNFSSIAANISRKSWGNSPYVQVQDLSRGGFRGPRTFTTKGLPEGSQLTAVADGIGTKTFLSAKTGGELESACDAMAMCCSDITRYGGIPLIFVNVLDVKSLGEPGTPLNDRAKGLLHGLSFAARKSDVVLFNGETAELGSCVSSDDPHEPLSYNWAGFAIGAYHPDLMITGNWLAPDHAIIAIKENFRSNGMSMVRKALTLKFGPEWWNDSEGLAAATDAVAPSALVDQFLASLNGWHGSEMRIPLSAIAHITGGGIPEKFGAELLFRSGLSAELDDLWDPPQIMRDCMEWRQMNGDYLNDEAFYRAVNGGQSHLLVVHAERAADVIAMADTFGHKAKVCGRILPSKGDPELIIHSKYREGERIVIKRK